MMVWTFIVRRRMSKKTVWMSMKKNHNKLYYEEAIGNEIHHWFMVGDNLEYSQNKEMMSKMIQMLLL